MKQLLTLSLTLILAMSVMASEGTVGGGGGNRVKVPEAELMDLIQILEKSRGELYLFFLAQTKHPSTPEMQRLFTGPKTIFDIIKTYAISKGDSRGCKDAHGNPVDGSVVSSPNTICISFLEIWGIDRDTARNQILSLVAHEYSHLLGFDETDAKKLQDQIYVLVGQESSESISRFMKDNMYAIGVLRGAIMLHHDIPSNPNWNYYCYMADKLDHDVSRLFNHWVQQYSFFDQQQSIQLSTASMRVRALYYKSCGESDYVPLRQDYLSVYNKLFGSEDSIPATIIAQHHSDKIVVDPTARFLRLKTTADFESELEIVRLFVEDTYNRMSDIRRIYEQSRLEF